MFDTFVVLKALSADQIKCQLFRNQIYNLLIWASVIHTSDTKIVSIVLFSRTCLHLLVIEANFDRGVNISAPRLNILLFPSISAQYQGRMYDAQFCSHVEQSF